MGAGIPHGSFQDNGLLQNFGTLVIAFAHISEFPYIFECRFQRCAGPFGNQLGQNVGVGQGQFHYPGAVANGRPGCHGAISDDLRYLRLPVFLDDIPQHLIATFVVEIYVDIRHRHPVGIQETFKQQVVFDGVDVGDANAVGHRRTGSGAPTRAYRHAQFARLRGQVLNDKKIARVSGLMNGVEFKVEPASNFISDLFVTLRRALVSEVAQVFILRLEFRRYVEPGKQYFTLK